MRVNITSTEADDAAMQAWPSSPPLSAIQAGDRIGDLNWWGNRAKPEDFTSGRHRAALALYEYLGAHTPAGLLPSRCFPAFLQFSDEGRRRPDKGWIKTALGNGIIVGVNDDELFFQIVRREFAQDR